MMDAKAAEGFCGHPVAASVGHNNPPEPTPYEVARDKIETLFGEALLWLDGKDVPDQDTADGLSNLLQMIREAKKSADTARREENEPFDLGKAEVQARFNPLLAKADQAAETIKDALLPWLEKVARGKAAAAEQARKEADDKKRAAEEAIRNSPANLADRVAAETMLTVARKAEAFAGRAAKETAKSGTVGKTSGLRKKFKAVLIDSRAAAAFYWTEEQQEIETLLIVLAARDVARGKRNIPGFEVQETSLVV